MTRLWMMAALIGGGMLIGCGDDDDNLDRNDNGNEDGTPQGSDTLSDGQVAGVSRAINQGEVDQGNVALPKLDDAEARAYATAMVTEHTAALGQQATVEALSGISAQDSPTRAQLVTQSQAVVAQLTFTPAGATFDRLYIKSQVDGHAAALQLMDTELLPSVSDPTLRAFLTDLRPHIAEHLMEAQDILASLP